MILKLLLMISGREFFNVVSILERLTTALSVAGLINTPLRP